MDSLFNNLAKKFQIKNQLINNYKIVKIKAEIKISIINQAILTLMEATKIF